MMAGARRTGIVLGLVLAASALALSSGWGAESRPSSKSVTDHHIVLRVAGARVIGQTLLPQLMATYLSERGDAEVLVRAGQGPWDVVVSGTDARGHSDVVAIRFVREDEALKELAAGQIDFAMMLRKPSAGEAAALATPANGPRGAPVALDLGKVGGGVLVNPANPVRSLTVEQVAGVFSGRIQDWSQVGGRHGRIHVYSANDSDIDTLLVDSLGGGFSVTGAAIRDAAYPGFAWPVRAARESALARSVAADPGGVTFLPQPFPDNLKVLGVQGPTGIEYFPSRDTVSSGDYAFCAHLYLLGTARNKSSTFINFVKSLTSSARTVAAYLAGLEPPGIALLAVPPKAGIPHVYRTSTRNGLRVSQTIHFADSAGSITPSLAAKLDVVSKFLEQLELTPGEVRLLAFTNPRGSPAESARQAFALGQIVKRELEKHHVVGTQVYGLGGIMPLAPGLSPRLRTLNRRVEIWVIP